MFQSPSTEVCEEQCVYESGERALYGVLYQPTRLGPVGAAVLCPPDGEERAWSQRHLVRGARMLAAAGIAVLRFDFMGQGESDGDYEESTIETRVNDLRASLDFLKRAVPFAPAIIGVRLGATVALQLALRDGSIEHLALWEPILNPGAYFHQQLRTNLSTQMVAHGAVTSTRVELIEQMRTGGVANISGFNLTGRVLEEAARLDPLDALARFRGDALVLTGRGGVDQTDRCIVPTVQCWAFWKEPKRYAAAPLPLVEPTIHWLKDHAS